jgi:hypothetical protein
VGRLFRRRHRSHGSNCGLGCGGILGLAAYPAGDSELGDLDIRGARNFPVANADFDRIADANCDSYCDCNRNAYCQRNGDADPLGIANDQRFLDIHRVGHRNCNADVDHVGKPDHECFDDTHRIGDRNCNLDHVGKPNRQRHADRIDDRIDDRDGDSDADRDRYGNFNCDCYCQRDSDDDANSDSDCDAGRNLERLGQPEFRQGEGQRDEEQKAQGQKQGQVPPAGHNRKSRASVLRPWQQHVHVGQEEDPHRHRIVQADRYGRHVAANADDPQQRPESSVAFRDRDGLRKIVFPRNPMATSVGSRPGTPKKELVSGP